MAALSRLDERLRGPCRPWFARQVRPGIGFRPFLEPLEDRSLLSILVVTDPGDSGANTLRGRIAAANPAGGDIITFAPGISQVNLTSASLTIDRPLAVTGPG